MKIGAYIAFTFAAALTGCAFLPGPKSPEEEKAATERRAFERDMRAKIELERLEREARARDAKRQYPNETAKYEPRHAASSGTGFFITSDGFLISNYHVIRGATRIRVRMQDGKILDATQVRYDENVDLALLRVEGTFPCLPVVNSRDVKRGQSVFTVGFPNVTLQGLEPKVTKGEISSLAGIQDDPRCFQTSVPLQPGNSGGPLIDERGNIVGVAVSSLRALRQLASTGTVPQNVNYAIKSSYLTAFLESNPQLFSKMSDVNTAEKKFEDVVETATAAVVLIIAE